MDVRDLYERCGVCWLDEHSKVKAAGAGKCSGCGGTGFVPVGLNAAQVEAHAADARRFQVLRAARLTLQPAASRDGWVCLAPPGTPGGQPGATTLFEGADPRGAVDAAVKGLGL